MIKDLKKRNQYHRDTLKKLRFNKPINSWEEIHLEIIHYGNSLNLDKIRLLDAGAGEGRYKDILNGIKNLEYIGVDNHSGSDQWDYQGIIKSELSSLNFIENDSIDIVIMIQVLSHINIYDLNTVIAEISKKMKKNAKIFITSQNMQSLTHIPYDYSRITPYGIYEIFKKHDLELQMIRPQFYGDNVSAANQLIYAMINNIYFCNNCGFFIKNFSRFLILITKVLIKILKVIDEKRDIPLNPVGYYAILKKN